MFLQIHKEIQVGDYLIPFRNDFNVYLSAQRVLGSDEILEEFKLETICALVYKEEIPQGMMVSAVESFFKTFAKGNRTSSEPVFDLEQDEDLIYAGFLQTYNIDLNEAELTIEQFLALLKGLPEGTRFAETIKIRTMPVPPPTKYNAEQRSAILRAKDSVALRKNRQDNLARGFKSFARLIKGMAKKDG